MTRHQPTPTGGAQGKSKNRGGRPRKFKSVEELEQRIQDYFDNLPTRTTKVGGVMMQVPCPTITGLALHLGFNDRSSFYNYGDDEQFSYLIKKAKTCKK